MSENIEQSVKDSIMDAGTSKDSKSEEEIKRSLSMLINEMSSTEQLALFSDLSDTEIKHLSVIETMDDDLIDEFADNFKANRISKGRKGRNELIELAEPFADVLDSNEGTLSKLKEGLNPL